MVMIVDGVEVSCDSEDSLLKCLLAAGKDIPSLCYHPALGADGRCGLCVIEVEVNDRWELQLACLTKPSSGLQVKTESERVGRMRAISAQLLLQRGPFLKAEMLPYLHKVGCLHHSEGRKDSFPISEGNGCILCGLCVRSCAKTGRGLLTFAGKGQDLQVYSWPSQSDCGNCRACIAVCPTGYMSTETKMKISVK